MALVIGIVAVVSQFFYKNINDATNDANVLADYTKFNVYFTEEVNNANIKVIGCNTVKNNNENDYSYISFSNGVQYQYSKKNKGIYRLDNNNSCVKLVENVSDCVFNYNSNNKQITVSANAGGKTQQNEFYLK